MLHERPEYKAFNEKYFSNPDFVLDIEFIDNPPADYIRDFFERLAKHEKYNELKNDFIYDPELKIFAHVHNKFPVSEVSDLSTEEVFFYSFMSKEEIKQIFNVASASDYLLQLRADQVETNPRLKRTFSTLKKMFGAKWSFTKYFESTQYRKYLRNLNESRSRVCSSLPHGTIHSEEANGMCLETPYGNIIVLSYALRHFLYYMNVFHFGREFGIQEEDTFNAFLLAIRIMIGTESLDFEIDPRGRLPKSISKQVNNFTDWQMRFIIGHEYAHHYLGHLRTVGHLKSHDKIKDLGDKFRHYTYSQQCEFDADFHSVFETTYPKQEKSLLLNGSFYFFLSLYLYQSVEEYLFPRITGRQTHPQPIDRLWRLRERVSNDFGYNNDQLRNAVNYYGDFVEDLTKNYLPFNVETIEVVGSIYLPTYRKKELFDRLDF